MGVCLCKSIRHPVRVHTLRMSENEEKNGKKLGLRFFVFLLSATLTHTATSTGLMEGDMAVPKMLVDNTVQQSFLKNASALWSEGRVTYKFEKMELNGGVFEQIFRDEDMKLITEVLLEISQAVPCIEFR